MRGLDAFAPRPDQREGMVMPTDTVLGSVGSKRESRSRVSAFEEAGQVMGPSLGRPNPVDETLVSRTEPDLCNAPEGRGQDNDPCATPSRGGRKAVCPGGTTLEEM